MYRETLRSKSRHVGRVRKGAHGQDDTGAGIPNVRAGLIETVVGKEAAKREGTSRTPSSA